MEDFKSPPTSLTKRCITHWYNISCEELISTLHSKEEEWKRYSNHLPTICPDPKVIEFIFSVSLYLNSLGIEVLPVTRYSAVRLLQLYLERKSVSTSSSKQKSHNSVESTGKSITTIMIKCYLPLFFILFLYPFSLPLSFISPPGFSKSSHHAEEVLYNPHSPFADAQTLTPTIFQYGYDEF
eukprot:TRINITY_DN1586_c1_g1_i1.p1 TRINITY_DN1586_c1_g1~~TRINITY_DN1586_c1_g1_i1.p1  ORF type:complete len:182 (+),score=12.21 TRINITY_DN1586_c1_g1_i1:170-715(+)